MFIINEKYQNDNFFCLKYENWNENVLIFEEKNVIK